MNLHTAKRRAKRRARARAGHWEIYPLGLLPAAELAFLETRRMQVEEVSRVFRLPLRMMVNIRFEDRLARAAQDLDRALIKVLLP